MIKGPGVVTGRSGTIGKVFYYESDFWPLNTTLYVKNFHGNNPQFVAYLLEHLGLKRFAASTGVPSLNRNFVHPLQVTIPPLPEQCKIAATLASADKAVEKTECVIEELQSLRRNLFLQLFERGSNLWCINKLGNVAHIQTGIAKGKAPTKLAIEVPYLRVANVQDGFLDLRTLKTIRVAPEAIDRYCLRSGDVLFTEGGDADKLGRGCVWRDEVTPCLHQNHIFAVRVNTDILIPEFLSCFGGSPAGREYFLNCAKQTTNLASINSSQLKAMPIPIPSLVEQRRIVGILTRVEELTRAEKEIRKALLALRSALANNLLTGKIRGIPGEAPS